MGFLVLLEKGDLRKLLFQLGRLKGQKSRVLPEGCRCNTAIASAALPTASRGRLRLKCDTYFNRTQSEGSIITATPAFDVQCASESKPLTNIKRSKPLTRNQLRHSTDEAASTDVMYVCLQEFQ